jgi:hypothetical protein
MERCIKITDSNEVCDKNIESIDFIFENCEYMRIPIESFKSLEIEKANDDSYSLSCIIEGVDKIQDSLYKEYFNPFQRIVDYDDITSIEIRYKNGDINNLYMIWEGDYSNFYQESRLLRFNKIKININKEVKQAKVKRNIGEKAIKILDYIYQDTGVNFCNDCVYHEDCKKMKQNKDIDICDVLYFLSNSYENN